MLTLRSIGMLFSEKHQDPSLVPRLSPSIYVRINNTREGKEGESLVMNRALPVRGQQLTRTSVRPVYISRAHLY